MEIFKNFTGPKDFWKICDICNIYISKTDTNAHEKFHINKTKVIGVNSCTHGFIKNNTFYASVSIFKGKVESTVDFQPQVFMHPTMMNMFNFGMGDCIVLNNKTTVCPLRVWPNDTIHITNVGFLSKQHNKFCKGEQVSVHSFSEFFKPAELATEITLQVKHLKQYMLTENFKKFLINNYKDVFIQCGETLTLNYVGDYCELIVNDIKCPSQITVHNKVSNISNISDEFASLNISEDCNFTEMAKSKLIKSYSHIKCSTPVMIKKTTDNINASVTDVFPIEFDAKDNEKLRCFILSPKTSISIKDTVKINLDSKPSFSDIGGMEKLIKEIKKLLRPFFVPESSLVSPLMPKGIVFSGPSGTGKRLLVNAIANECHVPVLRYNDLKISSRKSTLLSLRGLFRIARERSPCLLFLEDIHLLYPNDKPTDQLTSDEKSIMQELPKLIEEIPDSNQKRVLVIATTNKEKCLDSILMRHGRFEKEIRFHIPDINDRKHILEKLLAFKNHRLSDQQINAIVNSTHGFTGGHLTKVCDSATIMSTLRSENKDTPFLTYDDIMSSIASVKPSITKEFSLETPKVYWSDIGGMKQVKQEISDMIELPLKHPEKFKSCGIIPSRGILMYGPPGCSKTMIAKAVATESQMNFFSIKGPELFNKYVGESEGAIRGLFKTAQASSPCIIFFDEIDSLAASRGNLSSGSNVGERVLTQLLTEIDGINIKKDIYIIAATNRPDLIDPAFLRPGRFDTVMYVHLPDQITRTEIFQIKLKKVPVSNDVDIEHLVLRTEGYTCAEVIAVCNEAAMLTSCQDITVAMKASITMSQFEEALNSIKPRTTKELLHIYEEFRSQYHYAEIKNKF